MDIQIVFRSGNKKGPVLVKQSEKALKHHNVVFKHVKTAKEADRKIKDKVQEVLCMERQNYHTQQTTLQLGAFTCEDLPYHMIHSLQGKIRQGEEPVLSMLSWSTITRAFKRTKDPTVRVCVELSPYTLSQKQRLWVLFATIDRLGQGSIMTRLDAELFKMILNMV